MMIRFVDIGIPSQQRIARPRTVQTSVAPKQHGPGACELRAGGPDCCNSFTPLPDLCRLLNSVSPAVRWNQARARTTPVQPANNFCFAFDFDEWAALARTDPQAFEARRVALIEDYLGQFPNPEQQRLRGLQFRIDMERRRARTPMAGCLRLSAMMWDSLLGDQGLKHALDALRRQTTDSAPPRQCGLRPGGRVIPFRSPRTRQSPD